MSFKRLKQEVQQIADLCDELIKAAEKLVPERVANPKSISSKNDPKQIARFRQVELLAHDVAYTLDKKSKYKRIKDEDGVVRNYRVKQVPNTHTGLVSFVLYSDNPDNPRVHVLFRGTHSASSASRNLEALGAKPGGSSFNADKAKIMKVIKETVSAKQATCKKPIELSIAGHSLGGADAQNCAAEVIADIAKTIETKSSPLSTLGSLNIMLANAAGTSSATALKCKANVAKIAKHRNAPKINMFAIMVDGDPIQQAGYTTILADAPRSQVNINLLKADVGEYRKFARFILFLRGKISILEGIKGGYRAHTVFLFGKKINTEVNMRVYSNHDPKEALVIEQELKNKVYRKLNKTYNPLQHIKEFAKAIAKIKRQRTH